ncbi:MAG: methyltransferase domain-containing protein [Candidatus Moraniibacteriota bacterium]
MLLGKLDLGKIGDRLRKVDEFIVKVLGVRLSHGGLSRCVAESKRKETPDGIFNKRRQNVEDHRIALMKKWAIENDIDPNFAASIMYQLIAESCRVQDEIMYDKYQEHTANINEEDFDVVYAYQRANLLNLTKKIAPHYDENYGKGFFGSRSYFDFEKKVIQEIIKKLPHSDVAIDLGCATGIISFEIAHAFESVHGYDVSPTMIDFANSKNTKKDSKNIFLNKDIEEELDLLENSVSLAVMNMGTASEIKNFSNFLKDLHKCLRPGGKFFLSFYNSESLLSKIGFVPWPMPLAASIDAEKRCLEVQHNNELFFLYARPRSVSEVRNLLSDFKIDNILTFPTLSSLLPGVLMENEDHNGIIHQNEAAQIAIKIIDSELSHSASNCGTYIIVTGEKK